MPPPPCPSAEHLRQHLAGTLAVAEQAEVITHLDTCSACQQALEKLAADDSLLAAARQAGATSPPVPALQQVLQGLGEREAATAAEDMPLHFLRPSEQPGHLGRLGHYEVLDLVGRGGMGVVFRASDEKLQRVVAIKVLAPHLAGSALARQRFLREARAAAAVSHDHVVTIHAVEEQGAPYLVMQYVAGVSLQERLRQRGPLAIKEVLRIGMQAARGLAAAHAQGLVHRDVKPANILLENGVERVKITDFGLARAGEDVPLTQTGTVAGTPAYMSPEQANGEIVDARSDLFSLGTVLYEMCAGVPPFRGGSAPAVLRAVADTVPRPLRQLNPEVPAPLAAVIEKLHAKDPAKRYHTAEEVADILAKLLAETQQASGVLPARAGTRRRLAGTLAAVVAVALAVVAFLLLRTGTGNTPPTDGTDVSSGGNRDPRAGATNPNTRPAPEGKRFVLRTSGPAGEVRCFRGHRAGITSVAVSRTGQAVSVDLEGKMHLWDLAGGVEAAPARALGNTVAVVLSPDGRLLLGGTGGLVGDGRPQTPANFALRLWDRETGRELGRLEGHTAQCVAVAFSPDGKQALSGGGDSTVRLWDVARRTQVHCFRGHSDAVTSVAFAPDGKRALSGGIDRTLRLWDLDSRSPIRTFEPGHREPVFSVALSPDGKRALSGSTDGTMRLWEVSSGRQLRCFEHPSGVVSVAFSPTDGTRGLSASGAVRRGQRLYPARSDEVVRLWDLETGKELLYLGGHRGAPFCVVFTPDGGHALSGATDFTVRLWRLNGPPPPRRPPAPRTLSVQHVSLARFREWVAECDAAGYFPVWLHYHESGGQGWHSGIAVRKRQWMAWQIMEEELPIFRRRLQELEAQGFHLVGLTDASYAAVPGHVGWLERDATPAAGALVGVPLEQYGPAIEQLRAKRQRPLSLTAGSRGGSVVVTAQCGADDGTPWEGWPSLTEEEYGAKLKEWKTKGYRPLCASAYPTKGGLRFTLLVVKDSVTEWAEVHGLTPDRFKEWARGREKEGLRPLVIVGYPQGEESRYLGIWVKDELTKPLGPPPKKQ